MRQTLRALAIAVVVSLSVLPLVAQPTCPTPTIVQSGGPNPTCAGVPVTLDAGAGWASYQWSNGATTRTMTDSPPVTTSYWVTATDANGCSATSQPFQVGVVAAPAAPTISIDSASICAAGTGTATDTSSTSWATRRWSIANGTISFDNGSSITFQPNGAGDVTVTLDVTDANGCPGSTTATATLRTIPPPVLTPITTDICPGSPGRVYIASPGDTNTYWQNVQWSIANGTIAYGGTMAVDFTTDPSGLPTTLTAVATDSLGCSNTAHITLGVRSIPPPVLTPMTTDICPGSPGRVYIASPGDTNTYWQNVQWSIANGTIAYGGTMAVDFTTDPSGLPTTLTAVATDSLGCSNTASVTLGVRSIPPPVLTPMVTAICPGSPGRVYIASPGDTSTYWQNVQWSIANGTIAYGGTMAVDFTTDPSGLPATLTAVATDSLGCSNTASVTLGVRSIPPPVLTPMVTAICPGSPGRVYIASPGDTSTYWQNVQWSIANGTIAYGGTMAVDFTTDPSGLPATITAIATDSLGCSNAASVTIGVQSAPPATLTSDRPALCANGQTLVHATSASPLHGFAWAVTHGTISGPSDVADVVVTADGSGTVDVALTATSDNGCTVSGTTSIPLGGTAPDATITAPPSACIGSSFTASVPDAGAGASYTWSGSGATLSATNGSSATFVANGATIDLTVTVSSGGCSTDGTRTLTATTTTKPTITASGPTTFCAGGSVTLTASAGATYFWSTGATTSSIVVSQSGNYYVNVSDANGCSTASDSILVTVNPNPPTAITAGGPTTFCAGGAVTLTAPAGTSYLWTTGATTQAITVAAAGSYAVTVTDANGCSASSQPVPVTVVSVSTPTISGQPHVCGVGAEATLVASAGDSYLWSNGATTQSMSTFVSGSYTVTVTTNGCSATSQPVTVDFVSAPPPLSIASRQTYCPGETAVFTAANVDRYATVKWTVTNGTIVGDDTLASVTVRIGDLGPVAVQISGTDPNGCGSSNSVVVQAALPDAAIQTDATACSLYYNYTAVPDAGPGATYAWTLTNGTITYDGGYYINFHPDSDGPVEINVTVTLAGGCSASSSRTVSGTVMPTITATIPTHFCNAAGNAASVSDGGEGATYLWSGSYGATITSDPTQRNVTFAVDPNGSGGRVSVLVRRGGCTQGVVRDVWLEHTAASITPWGSTTFCEGGSVSLQATGGLSYLWSNGATTQFLTVTQSGTYSVTATGSYGCTATSQPVVITVYPKPTITGSHAACGQAGTTLTASAGDTYYWSNGATTRSITATQSGTYTVAVNTGDCGNQSDPFTVTSYPEAQIPTIDGRSTYCPGESGSATVPYAGAYASLKWTIANGTIVGPDDQSTVNFQIGPLGSGELRVVATEASGCSATTTLPFISMNPDATITANATACSLLANHARVPDAGPGATYAWSLTNAQLLRGGADAIFQPLSDGPVTIDVTVTASGGCSSSGTKTVDGIFVQPITMTLPQYVCQRSGNTASVSDGGAGVTYQWTATNATITSDPTQRSITFDLGPNGSAGITCTVTKGDACSYPFTRYVSVPESYVSIAADRTTLCAGQTAHLAINGDTYIGTPSYLWSNGATTQSIDVGPGTYTLTQTDSTGCPRTSNAVTVALDNPPAPLLSVTPAQTCSTTFAVTATVTNPTGYSSFWFRSNGSVQTLNGASASIDVPQNQPMWIEVDGTTASGCVVTGRIDVPITPTPDATITAPDTVCDSNDAYASVPDAGPGATYNWDVYPATITGGAGTSRIHFTPIIINPANPTNPVYVEITTAAGCTKQGFHTISIVPSPPGSITITPPTRICGDATYTASTPDDGPGVTYRWTIGNGTITGGSTSRSVTFYTANSGVFYLYVDLYVTGTNGCTRHIAQAFPLYDTPQFYVAANGPTTFCQGGSVRLTETTVWGSIASLTWSTGETTPSITVTQSGHYVCTVTSTDGCSASYPVDVTVTAPAPTITPNGPTTFCAGGSVTLTASPGYSSYTWSNGATAQSIAVSTSGSYSVTVRDANGCTGTSAPLGVTVNANPPTPTITAGGPTTFCAGGSVTLTAPSATSYAWSNGATTQAINVSAAGAYSVTVTNGNGCSSTSAAAVVTVNASPPAPTITAGGPTTFCAGGSVTLTAPSATSYAWSNGATTQAIDVSAAGAYSVTVMDANGCSSTSAATAVTINANPPAPTITAGGPTTFCAGGAVTLTASSAASYAWSNGATTQSITVSATGAYSVTVADANGCSATSAATSVTVNPLPTPTIAAGGPTTFCAGGAVTLTASPAASYAWSNGATTQSINVSAGGTYSVTVIDANGCSATSAATGVTVNPLPSPTITAGGPTTFCAGGTVTLTASSASSYAWSSGATTQSIDVSASGAYSVTVTDVNGCSATSASTSVVVNPNPPAPTITTGGPTTFCAGGSVTLTAPGGYSYSWSNGATTQAINVTSGGAYTVTVTDANGCSAVSAATAVTVNPLPPATITAGGPTTFCAGGSVTLTASSGTSYSWSNGATTPSINVTASGAFSVTVTDANGCSVTSAPTTVTVNANPPTPMITAGGPTTFCNGGSVTLTAPGGYTYSWSNGATTQSIVASASGAYRVTVTDANGCTATSSATTVTENPTITAFGPPTQTVLKGQAAQAIVVTATGPTLKYQWYKGTSGNTSQKAGSTTNTFNPPTGSRGTFNYWVRVTSGTCTADSATATVTVN
jgi:hypothetical protein